MVRISGSRCKPGRKGELGLGFGFGPGSEAKVGELDERKGHRDLMAGTAGDGFGELHVADASGEAGVRHGTLTQNRGHEVVLDTPAAFQLVGYR